MLQLERGRRRAWPPPRKAGRHDGHTAGPPTPSRRTARGSARRPCSEGLPPGRRGRNQGARSRVTVGPRGTLQRFSDSCEPRRPLVATGPGGVTRCSPPSCRQARAPRPSAYTIPAVPVTLASDTWCSPSVRLCGAHKPRILSHAPSRRPAFLDSPREWPVHAAAAHPVRGFIAPPSYSPPASERTSVGGRRARGAPVIGPGRR